MLARMSSRRPSTASGSLIDAEDLLGRRFDGKLVLGRGQQHRELVTAEPGHHVVRPREGLSRCATSRRMASPGDVAQRVVDLLEPVQVDEHDRHPSPAGTVRASSSRSVNMARFGRPVRVSWWAWCWRTTTSLAELLQELAAAQGHARVGGQGLEEPQVGRKPSCLKARSATSR